MNTGKFLKTLHRARQRFPTKFAGKPTLILTTVNLILKLAIPPCYNLNA